MSNLKKGLATLIVVGAVGGLAAFGTFSAFSSTSSNPGNSFTAGTVSIGDNDAGTALYSFSNAKPGDSVTKCINVTYTGSLDSDVKLYIPETIGALGSSVNLTITPGTQTSPSFPSCTGFTPASGGALYSGTLAAFASAYNSWANGLATYPSGQSAWSTNNNVVYKVTAQLDPNASGSGGGTTNTHSLTWEARNQ